MKTMDLQEFQSLCKHIEKNHHPIHCITNQEVRCVKYVYCSIDFRTNEVFSIKIRTWDSRCQEFNFTDTGPYASLKEYVMAWLKKDI